MVAAYGDQKEGRQPIFEILPEKNESKDLGIYSVDHGVSPDRAGSGEYGGGGGGGGDAVLWRVLGGGWWGGLNGGGPTVEGPFGGGREEVLLESLTREKQGKDAGGENTDRNKTTTTEEEKSMYSTGFQCTGRVQVKKGEMPSEFQEGAPLSVGGGKKKILPNIPQARSCSIVGEGEDSKYWESRRIHAPSGKISV